MSSTQGTTHGSRGTQCGRSCARAPHVRLASTAASLLSLLLAGACGPQRTDGATDSAARGVTVMTSNALPASDPVPAGVAGVGHHGENVYDMAKAGKWPAARASTDSLRAAMATIPDTGAAQARSARNARAQLETTLSSLDRAVTSRNSTDALRASNQVTELGARLAAPYTPRVPADVTLLDYYGRELEVWAAAKDVDKLRSTAAAMRQTWDGLRAQVEARGGGAEAARFGALVARVQSATTTAAYGALAGPVLAEVDNLESVFTK